MKLTKKLLEQSGACSKGIEFCERNKLFGFALSRLSEIEGDHNYFVDWLKSRTFNVDSNNNLILVENKNGYWKTQEYDLNNNLIRYDNKNGDWKTYQYDSNNNLIQFENIYGNWETYQYDLNNNLIRSDDSYGDWEIYEYDPSNNVIRFENKDGVKEYKIGYYDNGQLKSINDLYIPFIGS